MVIKEDVLQWFKASESYERVDLMHELLHMCLPFEVRFLGGCIEEIGKHSFQELRGPSIIANDIERLAKDSTQLSAGMLDRNCRHRMCIYLALLENRNCQCAHWYFKQVFRTEQWDEFAVRQKCVEDNVVLNELLMVFTLGRLHPAFNYHHREFFSDVLEKLYRIRADKNNVVKNVAIPNYPPGFGYPNHLVPYHFIQFYDQSATIAPQQQQPLDTHRAPAVNVKTSTSSTTAPSTTSSTSSAAMGGGGVELVTVATPPPPGIVIPQQHFPTQFEYGHFWRQPMYTIAEPHMMPPPPQPISPLVSQCTSPPHSRPASPSPSNHSTTSSSSTNPHHQQQKQQQHRSSSLRGSKNSSLESPQPSLALMQQQQQQQPVRMPSAGTVYGGQQLQQSVGDIVVKVGDNETNHIMCADDPKSTNNQPPQQLLHQDWNNSPHGHMSQHLHYTYAPHPHHHPHHQMAPPPAAPQAPNGLRQCFTTNFHHPLHGGGQVMAAIEQQQQTMFNYELEYQQQQQMNENLDNTLHQSGSSSNNSSNASSLNQSPPDTPASTPTPAHHGPGRGNRDGGIGEKLPVLNNVNSVPYMTPPPPPISDGNMPQQPAFAYHSVPYPGYGSARQMLSRVPPFTHSYPAPPPMTPHPQQVHAAAAQGQPPFISGYLIQTMLNANGNNPIVTAQPQTQPPPPHSNSNTNSASLRPHHKQHHQHQSTSTNTNSSSGSSLNAASRNHSISLAAIAPPPPVPNTTIASISSGSSQCCKCCCNCGSSEHSDTECTAAHIDDIVTQAGYTLDYDDGGVGPGGTSGGGGQQQQQQVVVDGGARVVPDI